MASESLISSLGARLKPAESTVTAAAVALLKRGPIDSPALVAEVCQAVGVRRALAESLARAILGHRPDVQQGPDGRWRLLQAPRVGTPRNGSVEPSAPLASPDRPRRSDRRAAERLEDAASVPLASLRFAVVDVETTGGRPTHGDRITEIAIVRVHDGEIVDVYETLVNPECSIPPMITQITRITAQMVRDKPVFAGIAQEVVSRLDGHVFVAHNAMFDWRFVTHEVFRGTGQVLDGATLCTVRLARKVLPQLPRRNLDAVANHYAVEIPPEARHRAAGDAIATAKVLIALLRDAAARDVTTWGQLDALQRAGTHSAKPRRKSAAPGPVKDAGDGA